MAVEVRARIEQRLRQAGLRLTPQRFAILDLLVRAESHPTAEDLGSRLNRRFPRVSRATIYNTLNSLCRSGLVREVYFEDGIARYDANLDPHHHFVCRVCRTLEDIPQQAVEALPASRMTPGYRIETYEVVMRGVCPRCAHRRR